MSKITTIKCDRCGREFDEYGIGHIGIGICPVKYSITDVRNNGNPPYDLCPKCKRSLDCWFEHISIDDDIFRQQSPIPI